MMQPVDDVLSDSKEMYLVTVARLSEPGQPVPLSHLARELSVTSVSVNEMCRKLQDQGYVVYQPYQGVWLTESGEKLANQTLRRHRLWEVFLVDKLGFEYASAHQIACQMEHITTDQIMDRLDQYLDYPRQNPVGEPIPSSNLESHPSTPIPLTELPVGSCGRVLRMDAVETACAFLNNAGILPGKQVTLIGTGKDNLLIQVNQEHLSLSLDLARSIQINQLEG